jgi:hypothetical protein
MRTGYLSERKQSSIKFRTSRQQRGMPVIIQIPTTIIVIVMKKNGEKTNSANAGSRPPFKIIIGKYMPNSKTKLKVIKNNPPNIFTYRYLFAQKM